MKIILQFVVNIIWFFSYTIIHLLMMLVWFGKLPKVSAYHASKWSFDFPETFNDITIQSRLFPDEIANKRAIDQFLRNNSHLLNYDKPLLNNKGEKIGITSLCNILIDINNKE